MPRDSIISDAMADQLARTNADAGPARINNGRTTLAETPELALLLDPAVAPAITGVGPDQGLRTYYVMFDNITGEVDFIRDER